MDAPRRGNVSPPRWKYPAVFRPMRPLIVTRRSSRPNASRNQRADDQSDHVGAMSAAGMMRSLLGDASAR